MSLPAVLLLSYVREQLEKHLLTEGMLPALMISRHSAPFYVERAETVHQMKVFDKQQDDQDRRKWDLPPRSPSPPRSPHRRKPWTLLKQRLSCRLRQRSSHRSL